MDTRRPAKWAPDRPFRVPAGVDMGMAKFIFTYRHRADYVPSQADPNMVSPWTAFFEGMASNVVDPGQPVFERSALGEVGGSTRLAGYSIVEADSLDAALDLARRCPAIEQGGGVEVGVLAELPAEHPASVLRSRIASVSRAQ
jgi:hypothetical protein